MKRIIYGLIVVIICLFVSTSSVDALSFSKGNYIGRLYVNKTKNGLTHYMRMRFIKDDQGRAVYCLEPFTLFYEGKVYNENDEYLKVSDDVLRKVELLAYYGYGYEGRTSEEWYVITQVLIWKVVDPNADVYFTDSLNGTRDDSMYVDEMNQLMGDVLKHDVKPYFANDYVINYGDSLDIKEFNFNTYEIVNSNLDLELGDYFRVAELIDGGSVSFKQKKTNYYLNDIAIYVAEGSQDLLLPGNIENKVFDFNINVTKGNIELNIYDNADVYSIENNFENVCYEILKDSQIVDSVCTNEELKYLSVDLPYGLYSIRQVSTGNGYVLDNNIYNIEINSNNSRPIVNLKNYIIKNSLNIEKYYCKEQCKNESGAEFAIYDSKDNLVETLVTDANGLATLELGYGKYYVTQIKGKDGYTMVDDFIINVNLDKNEINKVLEDNFIPVENVELPENIVLPQEGEIVPPDTGIKIYNTFNYLVLSIWFIKKIIFR